MKTGYVVLLVSVLCLAAAFFMLDAIDPEAAYVIGSTTLYCLGLAGLVVAGAMMLAP